MKMRILGILAATAVLLTMLTVLITAPVGAATAVTLTVGSAAGQTGDVVEIPVSISAGSFLVNVDMEVTYDPTALELVDTFYEDPNGEEGDKCGYRVNTSLFNSRWMYNGNERAAGVFAFSAATGSNTGMEAGGALFTLAFRILKSEPTAVSVSAGPICGNDGTGETGVDGYPMDYDLTYTAVNGTVSIQTTTTTTKPQPVGKLGDLNGDGDVNSLDTLVLFAIVSGVEEMTPEQAPLADFNGDGEINTTDVVDLFNRVAGLT